MGELGGSGWQQEIFFKMHFQSVQQCDSLLRMWRSSVWRLSQLRVDCPFLSLLLMSLSCDNSGDSQVHTAHLYPHSWWQVWLKWPNSDSAQNPSPASCSALLPNTKTWGWMWVSGRTEADGGGRAEVGTQVLGLFCHLLPAFPDFLPKTIYNSAFGLDDLWFMTSSCSHRLFKLYFTYV